MKLDLINIDEWAEELEEVSSPKIIENGRFSKKGLFSQQIFGPVRSYYCGCLRNNFKGINYQGKYCPACEVDITTSNKRKYTFAKIELPFEILNPLFYYLVSINGHKTKKTLDDLLFFKFDYCIDEDDNIRRVDEMEEDVSNNITFKKGMDGVIKYIKYICEMKSEKISFKYILDNMDQLTINNVLVLPPDFRNCGKNNEGKIVTDRLNFFYQQIIISCNHLKNINFELKKDSDLYKSNFRFIQNNVNDLYDYMLSRLGKKHGIIRGNILGKRVDFSCRAVISPDPTLSLHEVSIPYFVFLETMKPQICSFLVNRKICKRYNEAAKLIDEHIAARNVSLFKYIESFSKDKYIVMNRQPSLHRLSILAFSIRLNLGNTIGIPPLICDPFNADFDGDQKSGYIPTSEESINDVKEKLIIPKNLLNVSTGTSICSPSQDIVLGIYSLTK